MFAVLSSAAPGECAGALSERGYRILRLPPCPALDPPVASHPDMLLCPLGDKLFAPADYSDWGASAGLSLTPVSETLSALYPGDILLNALAVGSRLFCHPRISAAIRKEASSLGMTLCYVRQGYAHCGALALGESSMITADPSLAAAGRAAGLAVLSLPSGEIALPGYNGNGGLCGGSGGVDEESHTLFLCGTPPDDTLTAIRGFCTSLGYCVACLPSPEWRDVGGILFLREKAAAII